MSQKLKDSIGSLLTIFNISKHGAEIEGLRTGITTVTPPKVETIRERIAQRLLDLSPTEFEEFIPNLLSPMGFETTTTKRVGDKGFDIIGTLTTEGVATINLKVQVKRYRNTPIGIDEILRIRGTLAADEHGAFITTSTYTKQAQEEAQDTGKKPIALIYRDLLVDLVLKHFDDLDTKYQAFLGLWKKEIPLEGRFELLVQS